jgi:hypothetical protein
VLAACKGTDGSTSGAPLNSLDKHAHGTMLNLRSAHYKAKLTPEQVERIKTDTRISRLAAKDYGVSSSLIRNIGCGIAK